MVTIAINRESITVRKSLILLRIFNAERDHIPSLQPLLAKRRFNFFGTSTTDSM